MTTERSLTPTQDLMLDVLLARRRGGHHVWTFQRRHSWTARELEGQGLVTWKHGSVGDAILVRLTDAAIAEYMHDRLSVPLAPPEHVLRAAAHLHDAQAATGTTVDTSVFLRNLAEHPELLQQALRDTA